MGPFIIVISVVLVVAVAAGSFVVLHKKNSIATEHTSLVPLKKETELVKTSSYEMSVKFEDLPALTEQEETRLVEVKDSKLLSRIDNAVPGALQVLKNTSAIKEYQDTAKNVGQLYQAIIPKGAVLDKSRAMDGAFRGSYREVSNSIKGNANWVPVDNEAANKLAKAGAVNAVMNVASMVVGQYYMSQINGQLEEINRGIEKIENFQKNEFKSKVYALVAEIQKTSTFQIETMENDELRNRELSHLKSLEHECAQLLGQANLSLQEITGKKDLEYSAYEDLINEAEIWFQYQQVLLEVMYKISDLTYALNLGAISRENSFALCVPYANQSQEALSKLNEWHIENSDRLKIDIEENRRKRQGIEGFFMGALGFFNDDFNYKKISEQTAERIGRQTEGASSLKKQEKDDLYQEDVRLIAKDGKLFYLPQVQSEQGA